MRRANKGFSLVELIIVIAIMAILAGAIAPALIRYIDKSKKSNDVSSAKALKSAVEAALGSEDTYEGLVPEGNGVSYIVFKSGAACQSLSTNSNADSNIKVIGDAPCLEGDNAVVNKGICVTMIGEAIGEKIPRVKYKKKDMKNFVAEINQYGIVKVGLTDESYEEFQSGDVIDVYLTPDLDDEYQ